MFVKTFSIEFRKTAKPVKSQALKHKSSKEVEDDRIKTILETQRDQLLSEAKSEILKYENQSFIAEKLNLKNWKLCVPMMDTLISGVNEVYFTENWQNEKELHVILNFEDFTNWKH